MTVFGDEATFKCNWTDTVEFLALVGLGYDATQTPDEVRTFSPDFAVTGSGSGLVCVGIYGHTKDPLVKCHVIADWVNEPDGLAAAPDVDDGTLVVDGGPDTVYHRTVGDGSTPLRQYYSIRTERRRCGHISIPEPFSQWADKGMPMWQPVPVMLFV